MSDVTVEPVVQPSLGGQPDVVPEVLKGDDKATFQTKWSAILAAFDKALKDVEPNHSEFGQLKSLRNLVQVQADRVGPVK